MPIPTTLGDLPWWAIGLSLVLAVLFYLSLPYLGRLGFIN